jgi:hypothetical protein
MWDLVVLRKSGIRKLVRAFRRVLQSENVEVVGAY